MTSIEAATDLRAILDVLTAHLLTSPEIGPGEMVIMSVTEELEEIMLGLLPTQEESYDET